MTLKEINSKLLNVWATGISSTGALGAPLDHSAPTLAFIHGLGSSQNYFYGLIPRLLPKANAILIDTVGSAQSPLSTDAPTLDSIVGDVSAVLDHFEIKKNVILVGHSMGGMITLRSAELDSVSHSSSNGKGQGLGRISKIVLIGPVHPSAGVAKVFDARIASIEQSQTVLGLADAVSEAAVGSAATAPQKAFIRALISQQSPSGYIAMCNVIAKSVPPAYSSVKVPALILAGAEDKSAPYDGCVNVIEKGLAGPVKLEVLAGVGHWHCIEAPESVASAILEFI